MEARADNTLRHPTVRKVWGFPALLRSTKELLKTSCIFVHPIGSKRLQPGYSRITAGMAKEMVVIITVSS